jgi:hypothetical protein
MAPAERSGDPVLLPPAEPLDQVGGHVHDRQAAALRRVPEPDAPAEPDGLSFGHRHLLAIGR